MKIFQLTFIELSDLLTLNLCILMNVERMTVFWSLKCLSFTWSCWEMEKKILSFVPFNFLSFITKPVMKINYTSHPYFFLTIHIHEIESIILLFSRLNSIFNQDKHEFTKKILWSCIYEMFPFFETCNLRKNGYLIQLNKNWFSIHQYFRLLQSELQIKLIQYNFFW